MPQYEVNVVLNPNLDVASATAEKEVIQAALERAGATIANVDDWGNRKLAYPMKKDPEGGVIFYTVNMAGDKNSALEHELQLREHIRRVVIIKDRPEWRKKAKKA